MTTLHLPDWKDFTLTGELEHRLQRSVARMLELRAKPWLRHIKSLHVK